LRPVDVVIPIYNAPDHVRDCVKSVLVGTSLPEARILLANDASSDPAIAPLLNGLAADPRVVLVENSKNLGFVRNCNQVMRSSDHDVVLLNSDTVVGPGWLARLRAVAYSLERVGSVTPLSNNGEVCSSPWWFEPNVYPDRVSVEDLDRAAARVGTLGPVELPTGVGFCLYLRRAALDEVGGFDEAAFGRGYGEENDLCARMRHAGYLNLLAPTVFVGHVGGASFDGSGELKKNLKTLSSRWPGYQKAIAEYRAADPLRGVNSRFGLELASQGKDTAAIRPLYVLHYRTRIGQTGGTEHHAEDLIDGAGAGLDPLVLTFEDGRPVAQWDADGAGASFPAACNADDYASLEWLDRLLDCGVDIVHVQHPMGAPLDTLEHLHARASERDLPIVWTLHDYFTTCPCVRMVHADGSPCSPPSDRECPTCETMAFEEHGASRQERLHRYRRLIRRADLVFCPSDSAADGQTHLLDLETSPIVVPHGIPGERRVASPPSRTIPRVITLGYNAPHKGTDTAKALVEKTAGRIEWLFLGRDDLPGIRRSRLIRFLGTYDRPELASILEGLAPDAIALLSNSRETYLYTLSEAWRSGIPVFCTDAGAMKERVNLSGGGVFIDQADPEAAARVMLESLADGRLMTRLRAEAASAGEALPGIEEVAATYCDAYRRLTQGRRRVAAVTHPPPSVAEWRDWIGAYTVPFPSRKAEPLRSSD